MSDLNLKCDDCGRFMSCTPEASWAIRYDFVAMEPICERWRCRRCTAELGAVTSNARPHNGDMRGHQGRFTVSTTTEDEQHG
jgi:hypothetical protein